MAENEKDEVNDGSFPDDKRERALTDAEVDEENELEVNGLRDDLEHAFTSFPEDVRGVVAVSALLIEKRMEIFSRAALRGHIVDGQPAYVDQLRDAARTLLRELKEADMKLVGQICEQRPSVWDAITRLADLLK